MPARDSGMSDPASHPRGRSVLGRVSGSRKGSADGPPSGGRDFRRVLVLFGIASVLLVAPYIAASVLSPFPDHAASDSVLQLSLASRSLEVGANFPTYLDNAQRTSNVSGEKLITAADVANLTPLWTFDVGKYAYPQPIIVKGVVYEGSGTGYEYALWATNGTVIWKTFLGVDALQDNFGIVSTAAWSNGTIYVAGGNSTLYALNATTGRILWESLLGAKGQNYYIWSSPLVSGDTGYIGVDSYLDNPLVGSGLDQFFLSNGSVDHYFNTSFPKVNGSGIWSSPALSGSRVFVGTGNGPGGTSAIYSESMIAFNKTSLAFLDSYQVNQTARIGDGDFGATPTIYSVPTSHGPVKMVAAVNKNSILYAWYQKNLTLAWSVRVSDPGAPNDTITSAAWNGQYLFDISRRTTVDGVAYNESIRAFNGRTGKIVWQVGLPEPLSQKQYAAPLCFNGIVVVPDDQVVYFLNATNGKRLFRYDAGSPVTVAPSVSRGVVYLATLSGEVIALDLKEVAKAAASEDPATAMAPESFHMSASGGLPPYLFRWSFGDGAISTLSDPTHSFASPGSYRVSVTVTDLAGTVAEANLTVVVGPANGPPIDVLSPEVAGNFVLARFVSP
jgi:outer membrane protein assembly factor BamB